MTEDNEHKTWIQIAGQPPISLAVSSRAEADAYHAAEDLVNKVWAQYEAKYKTDRTSSTEIMAMVAFKFAWLYMGCRERTDNVTAFLKEFEAKLDDIVVKV